MLRPLEFIRVLNVVTQSTYPMAVLGLHGRRPARCALGMEHGLLMSGAMKSDCGGGGVRANLEAITELGWGHDSAHGLSLFGFNSTLSPADSCRGSYAVLSAAEVGVPVPRNYLSALKTLNILYPLYRFIRA